jgi:hypothetical protein
MILNPRGNSFYFNFPRGFFPGRVTEKYLPYIKKQPVPFDTVEQYINSTIQSVSFPSLTLDSVEQVRKLGKKISYKGSNPVQDLFSKEFSINMKMTDGFMSYWIMLDTILDFVNFANPEVFLMNLPLRIMDSHGSIVASVVFQEVLFTSFGEIELNYTSNNPQFSTFPVGFKCNYLDIKMEI